MSGGKDKILTVMKGLAHASVCFHFGQTPFEGDVAQDPGFLLLSGKNKKQL